MFFLHVLQIKIRLCKVYVNVSKNQGYFLFRSTFLSQKNAVRSSKVPLTLRAPKAISLFSRDEATLYERVSVRWLVRPLVRRSVGCLRFCFSAY